MNIDNLVRMANRIGRFFEAMPDRPQAIADIALHLERYWAPRMRQQLLAHVDAHGGEGDELDAHGGEGDEPDTHDGKGLDPLVLAAVASLRRPHAVAAAADAVSSAGHPATRPWQTAGGDAG